jgi:hypothetical protein
MHNGMFVIANKVKKQKNHERENKIRSNESI